MLLVVHHFDSDMFIAQCCFKARLSEGPTGFSEFRWLSRFKRSISKRFIYNVDADYTQKIFEFTVTDTDQYSFIPRQRVVFRIPYNLSKCSNGILNNLWRYLVRLRYLLGT